MAVKSQLGGALLPFSEAASNATMKGAPARGNTSFKNRLAGRQVRAAMLVAITITAYLPALRDRYVWDDQAHVTQSEVQRTWLGLKAVWTTLAVTPQYYPLTHTTFWIDYKLWGLRPLPYHAENIALHTASVILLWGLLSRLQVRGAWLAAAVFALHPIEVESVAWVSERKNVLSGFFYLLSMRFALIAWELPPADRIIPAARPGNASDRTRFAWRAYLLCLLFFVAGVLGKTVTSTLPAAVVLLIWWKRGWPSRRDWLMLLPLFAIALAAAKLTSGMEQWNVGAIGPEFWFSPSQRILIAGRAVWFYVSKLIWPHPLMFMYPRWTIDPSIAWQWFFPAAAVLTAAALWLMQRRIGRGPLVAALFFVGTLFPALGFTNVYPMRFSFVNDHFQYLAGIGLIALAAHLLGKIPLDLRARAIGGALLLAALGTLTWRQTLLYRDEPTLWRDTLAKNPDCWIAMLSLGTDAENRGDLKSAQEWYEKAIAVKPAHHDGHTYLARFFASRGRWDDAAREFAAAAAVHPDDFRNVTLAQYGEAVLAAKRAAATNGDLTEALGKYERLLQREPTLVSARIEYAILLRQAGRSKQSVEQYQKALEQIPDSPEALHGLADMFAGWGDFDHALQLMSEAVEIDPNPVMHNDYGVMLLRAARPAAAADQFSAAISESPDFAEAYDGLGSAMEAVGRTAEAISNYQKALSLKPGFTAASDNLRRLAGR